MKRKLLIIAHYGYEKIDSQFCELQPYEVVACLSIEQQVILKEFEEKRANTLLFIQAEDKWDKRNVDEDNCCILLQSMSISLSNCDCILLLIHYRHGPTLRKFFAYHPEVEILYYKEVVPGMIYTIYTIIRRKKEVEKEKLKEWSHFFNAHQN